MGDAVGEALLLFTYKVKPPTLQGHGCAEIGIRVHRLT